uniref:Uncharacterized protein n=1 Tax=Timema bartmani TaxID=61472 RepID=A0A7R9ENK3_9NEOP|nr:unnamed protein product [Timema bartmani]
MGLSPTDARLSTATGPPPGKALQNKEEPFYDPSWANEEVEYRSYKTPRPRCRKHCRSLKGRAKNLLFRRSKKLSPGGRRQSNRRTYNEETYDSLAPNDQTQNYDHPNGQDDLLDVYGEVAQYPVMRRQTTFSSRQSQEVNPHVPTVSRTYPERHNYVSSRNEWEKMGYGDPFRLLRTYDPPSEVNQQSINPSIAQTSQDKLPDLTFSRRGMTYNR